MSATREEATPGVGPKRFATVDCDVHPHFRNGIASLEPYLSESWCRRLFGASHGEAWAKDLYASAFTLPKNDLYINPVGVIRRDAPAPTGKGLRQIRHPLLLSCSTNSTSSGAYSSRGTPRPRRSRGSRRCGCRRECDKRLALRGVARDGRTLPRLDRRSASGSFRRQRPRFIAPPSDRGSFRCSCLCSMC